MRNLRLIGIVNILDGIAVQSIGFKKYLPIGNPSIYIEFLNQWGIDEIAVVDIKGSRKKKFELNSIISNYIKKCFVPISAGGGIKKFDDVKNLINNGADKVIFNSISYSNFDLLNSTAKTYGNQAVILSLDIKIINGRLILFSNSGKKKQKISIDEVIKIANNNGVGEIFLNSIDNDGKMIGFNKKIIEKVSPLTNLPITLIGGMGKPSDVLDLKKYNLSGIGIGNYYNYSERSVVNLKKYLLKNGFKSIRKTFYTYKSEVFDKFEKISKKKDKHLEKGYFVPHEILR